MATFTGTLGNDIANATTGTLTGFGGGTIAELQDAIGDIFDGNGGADTIVAGAGDDTIIFDVADGPFTGSYDGGGGTDKVLLRGVGDFVADGGSTDFNNIEEIEFEYNFGQIGTRTLFLNAEEMNSASELSPTLLIDGANGSTTDLIEIAMSTATTLDISGWTFSGWNSIENETITINGDGSAENITGSSQDDIIDGGGGNDTIDAGGGDDLVIWDDYTSGEVMDGGSGTDTLQTAGYTWNPGIEVNLVTGEVTDSVTVFGSIANFENYDASANGVSAEDVIGTSGDNTILMSAAGGDNTVDGGAGNDTIEGGAGADTLDGGTGTDTLSYAGSGAGVFVNLSGNFAGDNGGGVSDANGDTISNFEIVIGSAFDDFIFALGGEARGGAGEDVLRAENGGTYAYFGEGDNDTFSINQGPTQVTNSTFDGGAGTDRLFIFGGGTEDFRDDTLVSIETLQFQGDPVNIGAQFNANQFNFDTVTAFPHVGNTRTIELFMDTETTLDLSGVTFTGFTEPGDGVTINGDVDGETIVGSAIDDTINSGDGVDIITGGGGSDTINAGAGNDTINQADDGTSNDIDGGADTDILDLSASTIAWMADLTAGTGSAGATSLTIANIEELIGTDFADTLTGAPGSTIRGGDGADIIDGKSNGGTSNLFGDGGDDTFLVTGSDFTSNIDGGAGLHDVLDLSGANFNYVVDLDVGTTNEGGVIGTITGVEDVRGTIGFDTITGDGLANELSGNGGDDTIEGGAGADILDGGTHDAGGDTASYASSSEGVKINFILNSARDGDADGDVLTNFENLSGSEFDDVFTGDANANVLTGLGGADKLLAEGGDDTAFGGAGDDRIFGDDGEDELHGGADDDYISGQSDNDDLYGDGGIDTIFGGTGDDTISGGDEGDIINGGGGMDDINGDDGIDDITGGGANDTIRGGDGDDILKGYSGLDTMYGDAGHDNLFGDVGSDTMYGGTGNDILNGFQGMDMMFGGIGEDTLNGGDNADTMDGGSNNDILRGQSGNDILLGRGGDDTLNGGDNNDRINGGFGTDFMTGGTGNDTFVAAIGNANDSIDDFDDAGNDVIDITGYGFTDYATQVEGLMTQVGAHVDIDFGAGDVLRLRNTDIADMGSDDFILV